MKPKELIQKMILTYERNDYDKTEIREPDEYPFDEIGYNPYTGGYDPDL